MWIWLPCAGRHVTDAPVYTEFAVSPHQRLGIYKLEAFRRNVGNAAVVVPRAKELTGAELYVDDVAEATERLG